MSVVRIGATKQYSDNWDNIFSGGKGSSSSSKKAAKKGAKKSPKKTAKAAKKVAAKASAGGKKRKSK
jgi:hypothetical protein